MCPLKQEVEKAEAAPAPKRGPLGFLGRKAQQVAEEEEEEEPAPAPKRRPFSRGAQPRGTAAPAAPSVAPCAPSRHSAQRQESIPVTSWWTRHAAADDRI